jgi:hypothetical protein
MGGRLRWIATNDLPNMRHFLTKSGQADVVLINAD